MTEGAAAFLQTLGEPNPKTSNGLVFRDRYAQGLWNVRYADVGAGWYRDRFLYLFGPGLDRLQACLHAWSFMGTFSDPMIVGHNAYGALLVLENANSADEAIHVIDPIAIEHWTNPNMHLLNMIGHFIPNQEMRGFLDDSIYRAWITAEKRYLLSEMILAAKTPIPLGGQPSPDNFQEEEIVSFYQSTAPIYEKAMAAAKKRGGKGRRKPRGKSS
jgi:hypothetical protein